MWRGVAWRGVACWCGVAWCGVCFIDDLRGAWWLQSKLGMKDSDLFMSGPMTGSGGAAPAAAAAEEPAAAAAPAAAKTHFDIKLKAFDAKNKLKVIKEVRAVTNLGLKEVSWGFKSNHLRFCVTAKDSSIPPFLPSFLLSSAFSRPHFASSSFTVVRLRARACVCRRRTWWRARLQFC
jgi:hypothetical protein